MFVKPRLTAGLLFKGIIGFQGVRSAAYVEEPQNSFIGSIRPRLFHPVARLLYFTPFSGFHDPCSLRT
jgi:hypothetical protein